MRISDWSSDVCSSDLAVPIAFDVEQRKAKHGIGFLHRADRGRQRIGLRHARAVHQAGRATVAGAGVDAVELDHLPLSVPKRTSERRPRSIWRSEEHTSELQSLMRISYAVFCLKTKQYALKPNHESRETKGHRRQGNDEPQLCKATAEKRGGATEDT